MGFVKIGLDNVREPECVPEGEYALRVVKVEDRESKKGSPMTVLTIRIEDAPIPNPAPVMHYIVPPSDDAPADQAHFRVLDIKRLLAVFNIPYDERGFDSADFQGASAKCMLVQETGDDNVVRNRLKLPRLKE